MAGWLVGRQFFGPGSELLGWLIFGLGAGLSIGSLVGLIFGLRQSAQIRTIRQRTQPNQGLFLSRRNALKMMLIFGLMPYGGTAVIQHYTLRYLLQRYNHLPWHLVPFLDDMADHLLLRKVGGGYIFIHRLLLEYFASLCED